MTTDVDAFLEHHGVKGQKWGVRNDRAGFKYQSPSEKYKDETPAERKKRQQRNVNRARTATALIVTAAWVAAVIHSEGQKKATILKPKNKSFRIDPHDGRMIWNPDVKHDPDIIRIAEKAKNGAFQLNEYFKRQGHDIRIYVPQKGENIRISGDKAGGVFSKLALANVRRYNNKISKRDTPPPSQRAALALRRGLGKPTPSKEEVNRRFKEMATAYRKAYPKG
jgi:hypothetical protein